VLRTAHELADQRLPTVLSNCSQGGPKQYVGAATNQVTSPVGFANSFGDNPLAGGNAVATFDQQNMKLTIRKSSSVTSPTLLPLRVISHVQMPMQLPPSLHMQPAVQT
jgi:hypothetical protein